MNSLGMRFVPVTQTAAGHAVHFAVWEVRNRDYAAYAAERRYPTVRCSCPTCGLPDQERQVVKRLLSSLEADHAGLKTQMLAAMKNVKVGHLLDRALAARLQTARSAAPG